jgi:hypothetical protein
MIRFYVHMMKRNLDDILKQMEDVGLKLTSEDGVAYYLRVKIELKSNSEIHLTQPQLIDSILEDLNLVQGNDKITVTTKEGRPQPRSRK